MTENLKRFFANPVLVRSEKLINIKIKSNNGKLNCVPNPNNEVFKFRSYDSQIREMFEPEGKLIVYLTSLFLVGLLTTGVLLVFF